MLSVCRNAIFWMVRLKIYSIKISWPSSFFTLTTILQYEIKKKIKSLNLNNAH